jgi:hypothetical protein
MTTIHASPVRAFGMRPSHHSNAERDAFGDNLKQGALMGASGGALFGATIGGIAAAMTLGASTEGLAKGVTIASQLPAAGKRFAGYTLGAMAVGALGGLALFGAYHGILALNERFHL